MKRAVQHLLETALAQAILRGDVGEDETAVVGVDANEGNKRLFVTKVPASVPSVSEPPPAYDAYDASGYTEPPAPPAYSPETNAPQF